MRFLSKLRAALMLAGVAMVAMAGLATSSAQADTGYGMVHPGHSHMCLDVEFAKYDHGTPVIQGRCENRTNQNWKRVDVGGGLFELRVQHSGKCLDVGDADRRPGADVLQGDCWGGANQRWYKSYAGNGYWEIRASHSNLCLDVENGSTAHQARIVQSNCLNYASQRWTSSVLNG